MTNWIVVLIASASAGFWSLRKFRFLESCVALIIAIVSFTGLIVSAICLLIGYGMAPLEMSVFEEQKQYIEGKGGFGAVEDAALTNKKIELNNWLYSAQAERRRFGEWSVYPDSVLEMTPIE